jgi:hypothetical protein
MSESASCRMDMSSHLEKSHESQPIGNAAEILMTCSTTIPVNGEFL